METTLQYLRSSKTSLLLYSMLILLIGAESWSLWESRSICKNSPIQAIATSTPKTSGIAIPELPPPPPFPGYATDTTKMLTIQEIAPGLDGTRTKSGDQITIHYTSSIKNGPILEDNIKQAFILGTLQTNKALNTGLFGMQIGAHRAIIVPKGYDNNSVNAAIVYDVYLVDIQK